MEYRFYFICLIILLLSIGCHKDESSINPYFLKNYPKVLDSIRFSCDELALDRFIKFEIFGEKQCYYSEVNGRNTRAAIHSSFSTPGSSFVTGEVSNFSKGLRIYSYMEETLYADHNISLKFLNVSPKIEKEFYLDSIFNIKENKIQSNLTLNSSIEVSLEARADTNGNIFVISSRFGNQDQSYLRILKANKYYYQNLVCYELECEFECNLYHWQQYGKKGLYATLKNGLIKGNYCVL